MANVKRFVSFRLYIDSRPEEVQASDPAGSDLLFAENGVGNNMLGIRARREQYASDRLHVLHNRRHSYRVICSQIFSVMIFAIAIWMNVQNWKGFVLFALAVIIGAIHVCKLIWPHVLCRLKNYWKESD